MTTQQMMVPRAVPGRSASPTSSIPEQLRATARRRQARARELRAWSREVKPALGHSLRRRAAELELGAVALEMRAEGLETEVVGAAVHSEEE